MKLTNYMRESFVRAVMNDIPEVKWPTLEEAQKLAVKLMSPKVKAVYNDPETRKSLVTYYYGSRNNHNERGYIFLGNATIDDVFKSFHEQDKVRREAHNKLEQASQSCTTVKQLKDMFPEFAKYAPDETGKVKSAGALVVTGVLEAVKAAGWPK